MERAMMLDVLPFGSLDAYGRGRLVERWTVLK